MLKCYTSYLLLENVVFFELTGSVNIVLKWEAHARNANIWNTTELTKL